MNRQRQWSVWGGGALLELEFLHQICVYYFTAEVLREKHNVQIKLETYSQVLEDKH